VGTGFCQRTGVLVCDQDDPSHLGTECTVSPGAPSAENTPGVGACLDTVDNDCDGSADLTDTSCQEAERCDGFDNDGDTAVDEDFADLGAACSAGLGACHVAGVKVCGAGGAATSCNAVALLPGGEGPFGVTCSDGIDNDCDGFTDMGDANCNAAALSVQCALPFATGRPGDDCTGKHRIVFQVSGASPTATVTAELLGLTPQGAVLASLPVSNGDEAHLASRLSPGDFRAVSKVGARKTTHEMFAPVPLLKVTVDDAGVIAEAYCSNIAYLDVVQPTGEVISASEDDVTLVKTAIPFVEPTSLVVRVDGVDILAALGIDPATDLSGPGNFGPFAGAVTIGGKLVQVEDLFVRTALAFATPSANSLSMTLSGLGGGGHIVFVDGEPSFALPPVTDPTDQCHRDDVVDTGTVAIFGITITSPVEGEVTSTVPTPVTGEVRHGRHIVDASVNGLVVDTSAEVCTTGDGVSSADECVLPINVALGQTNLTTGSTGGTFDRGQNDILARARDDDGNLAYASHRFTVGDNLAPGLSARAAQELQAQMNAVGARAVQQEMITALSAVNLQNALVLGVSASGIQTFFSSTCKDASLKVKEAIRKALLTTPLPDKEIDAPFPACNPTAKFNIFDDRGNPDTLEDDPPEDQRSVRFNGDVTCTAVAQQDKVHITVSLPEATAIIHVTGGCETEFLGICLSEVKLNTFVSGTLSGFSLNFDVTEEFALAGGEVPSQFVTGTVTAAALSDPAPANEVNCIGVIAAIIGFFTFGIAGLIVGLIFEFGADGLINAAVLAASLNPVDIQTALRKVEEDPVKIKAFKLEEINAELQSKLGFVQELVDVQITPDGLVGSLNALWEVKTPDPEEGPATFPDTVAPPPVFPIAGAKDAFFVLSDDFFSMLYSGLTIQGALKSQCVASGLEVLDILPTDCDALATAGDRGRCHGAKGADCGPLGPVEQAACINTRNRLESKNISPTTPLLFCARRGITPRLLIEDEASSTSVVETRKHLNDLRVVIVLDRAPLPSGGDGVISQSLLTTRGCFSLLGQTDKDCKWADVCLDIDVNNNFTLATSAEGNPMFVPTVGGIQDGPPSEQCGGVQFFGDDENLLTNAGASDPITIVANNIDALTPLFEADGFDLGDFVRFEDETVFAIETQLDSDCPSCREYFGITATLTEEP
jgi:hypothetical protein